MPKVGKKEFPYTKKGMMAAKKESVRSGVAIQKKKKKKY